VKAAGSLKMTRLKTYHQDIILADINKAGILHLRKYLMRQLFVLLGMTSRYSPYRLSSNIL
jgi:hypothetical protein